MFDTASNIGMVLVKAVSLWQPYASLIVHSHKFVETRSWAAPKSLIGQRIAIASTKTVKPEQRAPFLDEKFARYYSLTDLPGLEELPHGYVLGTALLYSCDPMTQEDLDDGVTDEELTFGWWSLGRYAWRLRDAQAFSRPIPCRGAQGVWEWSRHEPRVETLQVASRKGQVAVGQADLRANLQDALGSVVLFGKPKAR